MNSQPDTLSYTPYLQDETDNTRLQEAIGQVTNVDLPNVPVKSISDIQTEEFNLIPVKIVGTIASISNPEPVQSGDNRYATSVVTLRDLAGNEIQALRFDASKFGRRLRDLFNNQSRCMFYGFSVSVFEDGKGKYLFYLEDVSTTIQTIDLIGLTDTDIGKTKELAESLRTPSTALQSYIKDKLVSNLKIQSLDRAKELDRCIDFMIIQAFSDGMESSSSLKLHSLVIGPPAVGKGLLTTIAMVLNPVAWEVSSTDAKVTPAGLIGDVQKRGNRWISNSGILPCASSGVVCIQDYHNIRRKRDEIFSILSQVMEDGAASDSTRSRQTHKALTSIHMDMNRPSQVAPNRSSKSISTLEDIDIPDNILSRFDFIMEIPRDLERQVEVAESMLGGGGVISTYSTSLHNSAWVIQLRNLVAWVRTEYSGFIPDPAAMSRARTNLDELVKSSIREINNSNLYADTVTRAARSAQKYIKAICTLKQITVPDETVVDMAMSFISEKFNFLKTLNQDVGASVAVPTASHNLNKESRHRSILEHFGGQEVTVKQVHEQIIKKFDGKVSEITVRRDLDAVANKMRHGFYSVPDISSAGGIPAELDNG